MGRSRKDLDDALKPLQRRATVAAKAAIATMDNNTKLLREGMGAVTEREDYEKRLSTDRRDAIRGISLADLSSAAGTRDENEDMEAENDGGDE